MARRSAESRGIGSPTDGRRRDTGPPPGCEMLESGELQLRLPSAIARIPVSEDGSVRIRAGAGGELPPDLDAALGRAPWMPSRAELQEREEGGLLLLHSGRLGDYSRLELHPIRGPPMPLLSLAFATLALPAAAPAPAQAEPWFRGPFFSARAKAKAEQRGYIFTRTGRHLRFPGKFKSYKASGLLISFPP